MKINLISKGCGQGKTQQALDLLATTGERYILAQPSILLINQSMADLRGKNATVRARAIHTENTSNVSQTVREAMAAPMLLAQSPHILLASHQAMLELISADKAKWHLIVDEILNVSEHLEYQLKLTRRWVARHLSIGPGIGDTYELGIKAGHVSAVEEMVREAKRDSNVEVMSKLWRLLLHPHYRVFVTKAEWLAQGAKASGRVELNAHAVLQPSVFDGYASVTLMGANARSSRLVQVWSNMGVEFGAHPSIPDSEHDEATGKRLTVRYLTNKPWTKSLRDNELKKHGFHDLVVKLGQHLPDQYIWSANNLESGRIENVLVGTKLPPVSHGMNRFRHMDAVVSLGSYNDDLAHSRFLTNAFQLSDDDLFRSRAGEMAYQLVMRTALRSPGDSPVAAFVPDWRTAEYLNDLLPGSRSEQLDLGIAELAGAKPRFKVKTTPTERSKATREKQAAAIKASNQLLELHRIATGALIGETPIIITTKAVVATTQIESHALADWDTLYALLESDRHRKLPKDKAGLLVGSLMDPDATPDSVAGLANVVYTQMAWMDIDDGDIAPAQASLLVSDVKHLVYSSFNNGKVAGKHRYRIVIPMDKPVDADTYRGIWRILANRFAQAGYWVPEKAGQDVPANQAVSGLDFSKCKASDFMYRPVRTGDPTKNVWITAWEKPILNVETFAMAIESDEDEMLDLWMEERRIKREAEERIFAGQPDLLLMFREQAAVAVKRNGAQRVAEDFANTPAGGMNQKLYRLAKWLIATGHSPDEMHDVLYGLLIGRSGGRSHLKDLRDIRDDAIRGKMRIAR